MKHHYHLLFSWLTAMLISLPVAAPAAEEKEPGASLDTTLEVPATVNISSRNINPPRYPPAALVERMEGEVILIVSVDSNGTPVGVDVERSSGHALLDQTALDAASKWRYQPGMAEGKAVQGQVRIPVRFSFD